MRGIAFLPAIIWLVLTVILFGVSQIELEPNDTEQIMARSGSGVVSATVSSQVLPIGEGEFELTYMACVDKAGDAEPVANATFFTTRSCTIIADPGETAWLQITLENRSDVALTNFTVEDSLVGEIAPSDECWRIGTPIASRENDPGWGGGEAGALPGNGDMAVCMKAFPVAEDAEDQFDPTVTVSFDVDNAEEIAPEGTQAEASQVIRVVGTFPVLPNIWLPGFGFDEQRVIDVRGIDMGLSIYFLTLLFAILEAAFVFLYRGESSKLLVPIIRAAGMFILFWSFFGHEIFWDAFLGWMFPQATQARGEIQILGSDASVIQFASEHLELVIVSSLIIIPVGLAIGILVTREDYREFLPLLTNLVNLGQTIPTLAIVAIMAPIIGLGFTPAIIALFIYGLLPVVRNTIAGLEGVDSFIIDSARGMGMTPAQILVQIELPIASRIIMAGIRTSMVINVGTAALGAYVISGGLGEPIADGLLRSIDPWVMLGAIPAALLAILIDYILGRIEFVLTPSGLQIEG
jgi:osmoprotectant transport system permease protein